MRLKTLDAYLGGLHAEMTQAQRKKTVPATGDRPTDGLLAYQQRVSREKRKLILEVAIETFLANGYEAATMDSIGDRAAVSYATLYKHFPGKEDLFSQALDHLMHQQFARWKDHTVPVEVESGLREIGRAYNELVSDSTLIAALRLVIAQVRNFPDIGVLFQRAKNLFSDVTDVWLTNRVEEGGLQIADVQLARAEFIGMLGETLFFPRLLQIDYAISDDQVEKIIGSAVSTFLMRYRTR
ncbi:TetR/AcrR family transcriptional regulator of autoinduction and epiphytic fitness [Paraburkholderia sp. MM5496-R1]|uniref:TetR/AcrR family transcriptional regulator n=1 Tax=unclassified Paraburkholderia TaxID=2615204 RepID=UPI003D19FB2D